MSNLYNKINGISSNAKIIVILIILFVTYLIIQPDQRPISKIYRSSVTATAPLHNLASQPTSAKLPPVDNVKVPSIVGASPAGAHAAGAPITNAPLGNSTNKDTSNHSQPHITAQALATCLVMAAQTYKVPAAVLIGMMQVEGGVVGEERQFADGSKGLGPFLINSKRVPELATLWKTNEAIAASWLSDNGCVNVHVAAWLLAQKIAETGSLYAGIAAFHAGSDAEGHAYADKVVEIMEQKGLINHDIKSLNH